MKAFDFKIISQKDRLRLGKIFTPHGVIETPAFVPVGTQATVKSLTPEDLEKLGVELFFVNTYHVYLRPGVDVVKKFAGLHKFTHWDRPLITDSGGFQVFSLQNKRHVNIAISESAVLDRERFSRKMSRKDGVKNSVFPDDYRPVGELVKIDEDGVTFTSHWDGSIHRFTPERSIQIQHDLGADILIAFDECAAFPTTHEYAAQAMERTHRWALRSLTEHQKLQSLEKKKAYQALYGVVQGSIFKDLREQSARFIAAQDDFDGIAIGGVSVGESKEQMCSVCDWVIPLLPDDKPRHLLGVGEIDDIFDIIERGIDTFDCVQPTRLARMGHLLMKPTRERKSSRKFTLDITKSIYEADLGPIEKDCTCYTCQSFSRAYLHHLFHSRELLAYRLATFHNLHFVISLVKRIRRSIAEDSYLKTKALYLGK